MAELGSDIAGVFDVDTTLSVMAGRRSLATAIFRRLFTPRGGLLGSPTYGYDVTALIGSTVTPSRIEQLVTEQVLDEEEVEDASAVVTFNDSRSTLRIEIQVVVADGPFALTVAASELSTELFLDNVLFEIPEAA